MKREPELRDLSRDHHHALVLARRASRAAADGDDASLTPVWETVCEAFAAELEPHFRIEEDHLLPALLRHGRDAEVGRTRDEHARIRALVADTELPLRERLAELGALLTDHVRFEERVLFPLAEADLDPAELAAVAHSSLRHK